jgi:hypothetical protein
MSILVIRKTRGHVAVESRSVSGAPESRAPSLGRIFYVTSLGNVSLFAACQAGLVNNLAWVSTGSGATWATPWAPSCRDSWPISSAWKPRSISSPP